MRNRIWMAPMCQYAITERDGVPRDWHLMHLGARGAGGFGLIITESTAVSADARLTPQDVGLWNSTQQDAWARIVEFVHGTGAAIAVQLAHAGRKASTWPWLPRYRRHQGTIPELSGGWRTVGPTTEPFPGLDAPEALTTGQIAQIVQDHADAARRAVAAGFDAIELHFAHGHLVHEFLSPLVNTRSDAYGGDEHGRRRLAREIVQAVRAEQPESMPLIVRISATDWINGGWDLEQSCRLGVELHALGTDVLHVSSGGAVVADIAGDPWEQIAMARRIRECTDAPVAAVGRITEAADAQRILTSGNADFVALGRAAVREPSWPQRAAHELGADPRALYPEPYARGAW